MLKVLRGALCAALLCAVSGMFHVGAQDSTRTIEIHAKRFSFSPSEINLKKGETVTFVLTSDDVPHSLVIDGLGVKGDMIKGQMTKVNVTPTKDGDFQGKCGRFCGTGHGSMRLTVHVTDN
jgi:cytochrome c oxidase subunit II